MVDANRQVPKADPASDSPHGDTTHVGMEACVETTKPLDCTLGQNLGFTVRREQPQASPRCEPSAPAAPRHSIVGVEDVSSSVHAADLGITMDNGIHHNR